jgi:hypothetical protein
MGQLSPVKVQWVGDPQRHASGRPPAPARKPGFHANVLDLARA